MLHWGQYSSRIGLMALWARRLPLRALELLRLGTAMVLHPEGGEASWLASSPVLNSCYVSKANGPSYARLGRGVKRETLGVLAPDSHVNRLVSRDRIHGAGCVSPGRGDLAPARTHFESSFWNRSQRARRQSSMLNFRKHRRPPAKLPIPRFLLMLIGLGVFLFIVTWRSQRVGDVPVAPGPAPDRDAAILEGAGQGAESGADQVRSERRAGNEAYFPGVHPQYLQAVRDNTVFRAEESDAWFHLLRVLEDNSERQLADSSGGPVGYLQLDRQPLAYRGRLVTISGTVRSAQEIAAPKNSYGIERYYQVWLQPLRSDPELIVVYVLHLPANFPVGEQLDEAVSATGFFFKRWAYPSRSGILTAPLVLARSLEWQPASTAPVPGSSQEQTLLAVLVASVFALGVVSWVWRRGRRPHGASETGDAVKLDAQMLAEATDQPPAGNQEGN